ncbi:MAG: GC-type dockerin domain-anchored protein [Phycisphaerales bacterium]
MRHLPFTLYPLAASTAFAGGTITSGDASLQFVGVPVFSTNLGDTTFKTDATAPDQGYKLTWYYRTQFNNTNRFMSSLDTPVESYVGNTAVFTYTNAGPGPSGQERFDAVITSELSDGTTTNQSRVTTSCRAKSRATTTLTYQFFLVVDLDLAGGAGNPATDDVQTIAFNGADVNVLQSETSSINFANIAARSPTRYQIGSGSAIRSLLGSGQGNLNNLTAPFTGDGAVAFQFTRTLQPGEEVTLSAAFAINDVAFCVPPSITQQPADTSGCAVDSQSISVGASSSAIYQWRFESPANSGSFVDLVGTTFTESASGLSFQMSGVGASTLAVSNVALGSHPAALRFRARAINPCGTAESAAATVTINDCPPQCPADFNDDGGVDGDDVIAFFAAWDAAATAADVNADGGVDGDDVIYFFGRWDAGC